MRITQDLKIANDKNKIQLSFDFLNIGNMLNSDWGLPQFAFQQTPLNYRGRDSDGEPIYRLNVVPGTTNFPSTTSRASSSIGDTWRLQVGVRYLFN